MFKIIYKLYRYFEKYDWSLQDPSILVTFQILFNWVSYKWLENYRDKLFVIRTNLKILSLIAVRNYFKF